MMPFAWGTCWQCGDTQGPWDLCSHPKYNTKIWLCEKCARDLEENYLYLQRENPYNESNNVQRL